MQLYQRLKDIYATFRRQWIIDFDAFSVAQAIRNQEQHERATEAELNQRRRAAAAVPPSEQAQAMSIRTAPVTEAGATFQEYELFHNGPWPGPDAGPVVTLRMPLDTVLDPVAAWLAGDAPSPSPEADAEARLPDLLPCKCGQRAKAYLTDALGEVEAACTHPDFHDCRVHTQPQRHILRDPLPPTIERVRAAKQLVILRWNAAARQPVADAAPLYDERVLDGEEITCPATDVIRTNGHDHPLKVAQYARNLAVSRHPPHASAARHRARIRGGARSH